MSGEEAIIAMAIQHDRGNGLGGGFAGYGIYPEFPDHFAVPHDVPRPAREGGGGRLHRPDVQVDVVEPMPTGVVKRITDAPHLWRYFLLPDASRLEESDMSAEDYVVSAVMHINANIDGAYVSSSGKNMGAFKGVGYPEEIGHYYKLEE